MAEVCLPVRRTGTWVIHICKHTFQAIRGAILHSLKCLCGVGQPKKGKQILKQAKWCYNCSFWDFLGRDRDLVITLDKIDFEKIVQPCRPLDRSCMFGKGYLSGVVTKFKWRKSPQGRHNPSFLGTMCKGEANGDFDLWTMPADSNLLNFALAICNFSGLRRWDFAKTGGWLPVWIWCLTPWLGVGFTSPVLKIEGNFCSRVFTSSGTESGIFFIRGGRVQQRLVFPKTGRLHLGILD